MGLYDDRMADLSESRRSSRAAGRPGEHPYPRGTKNAESSRKRDPMDVQSLLFSRDSGWTVAKAKAWAKEHGYKYGKVDVTEQYIHMRQFSPKGLKVKRTITLGRGIRAVVAREENMAGTVKARRRSPRKKKASTPRKRSTRRKTKARATTTRRRKRSTVMAAAPKRRRRKPAAKKRTTRRRRTTRATGAANEAWYGDTAGHRRAAKKGVRRKKRKTTTRRRRARASEPAVVAAPRRRKRSTTRRSAPRRRTRAYAAAPRRRSAGMGMAEFGVAVLTAGFGYVVADGLDRFLATYNPAETDPEKRPKDKFTSDGAGTLANTLNVASPPGFMRIGAGVGMTALPAVASYYVDGKFIKSGLQGLAIGSGVNLFKTLWNNVLMPMLKPKDTAAASLQKSYIARLYPSEVAASINREQKQTAVSSAGGAGALSDAPADVGPFALSRSEYPNAAEALRAAAGTGGTPGDDYPTVQNVEGTSRAGDFPTATQAMTEETGRVGAPAAAGNPGQPGVAYEPGPPPLPGPGPQAEPGEDPACGCMNDQFLGLGEKPTDELLYSIAAQ